MNRVLAARVTEAALTARAQAAAAQITLCQYLLADLCSGKCGMQTLMCNFN